MKHPICMAIGRVFRPAAVVTPPNGTRPFVAVTIELTRRRYEQTSYAQRVEVRIFSRDVEDTAQKLQAGLLVSVQGEADAFVEEVNGRHFANLRVTGTVTIIPETSHAE